MKKLSMDALNRLSVDEFKNSLKMPLSIVLDNVRSMYNVGSIFRSADAFRIEKIFLCGITASPPHKEIEKTALGATESVNWVHSSDTLKTVKQLIYEGYDVYSAEQVEESTKLNDFRWIPIRKSAVVFGNEVMGVSQDVIDICKASIEIPQVGTKHSLNVSISAGIIMWHFFLEYLKNKTE